MNIPRRRFLRHGATAAVASGLILKSSEAPTQGRSAKPAGSTPSPAPSESPSGRELFARANFLPHLNTTFRVSNGASRPAVAMKLTRIVDQPERHAEHARVARACECYTLVFAAAGRAAILQDTYQVEHPGLGKFQMFLAPAGGGRYEAVVNRLI